MRLAVALACLAGQVSAQTAPETSLVPEQRPASLVDIDPEHEAGGEVDDPADIAEAAAVPADCIEALDARDVVYEVVEPITDPDDPACGVQGAVQISEIAPGIDIGDPILRCDMSLALAEWVQDVVLPATEILDGGRGEMTGLMPGTTYNCRRRNNQPDGKLSEHAFGNAFDVMAITFAEGPPLPVQPYEGDSPPTQFQAAIRAGACDVFTTVLGPGSDPAHDNHFHFDIKQRNGDYRICE